MPALPNTKIISPIPPTALRGLNLASFSFAIVLKRVRSVLVK